MVAWERVNGPLPKGYAILFLDGNKQNTDISNLRLMSRSELLIMNRFGIKGADIESMNTAANLAQLIDKTNKVIRKKGEKK